jgi:hypothetical protein
MHQYTAVLQMRRQPLRLRTGLLTQMYIWVKARHKVRVAGVLLPVTMHRALPLRTGCAVPTY